MLKFVFSVLGLLCCVVYADAQGLAVSGQIAGRDYVDLGLPSGTKWATCNVGAEKTADFGERFSWGETKPSKVYSWTNYKWCKGSYDAITKYCLNSGFGPVDNLSTLQSADDAASVNWSADWRVPTKSECDELLDGCNWKWIADYNGSGVAGRIGTSKSNGNTIFFPAAGLGVEENTNRVGSFGVYASSTLDEDNSSMLYAVYFEEYGLGLDSFTRFAGLCVRAVGAK